MPCTSKTSIYARGGLLIRLIIVLCVLAAAVGLLIVVDCSLQIRQAKSSAFSSLESSHSYPLTDPRSLLYGLDITSSPQNTLDAFKDIALDVVGPYAEDENALTHIRVELEYLGNSAGGIVCGPKNHAIYDIVYFSFDSESRLRGVESHVHGTGRLPLVREVRLDNGRAKWVTPPTLRPKTQ